jgi:ribonuclease HI
MRCTPHASLQVECGELPLALRRTEILMRHCVRITANTDNPSNISLQDNWYNYIPNTSQGINHILRPISHMIENVSKVEVPSTPPWLLNYPAIDSSLSERVDKKNQSLVEQLALAKEYMETWSDHIPLYTDGSKAEHKTACAFHYQGVSHSWRLADDSSVYGAELHAIKHALQYLLAQNITNTKIVIFTDSLSACTALSNIKNKKSDTFILSILEASSEMRINGNSLAIAWIPSHVGIPGNELADKAARDGLTLPLIAGTQEIIAVDDCYSEIKRYVDAEWQRLYDNNNKISEYKKIEPNVSRHTKFLVSGRSLDRVMTRLRLGYCLTNSILYLFKRLSSPNCILCNVEENLQHLISCQATNFTQGIPTNNIYEILSSKKHLETLARNILASGRKI